MTLTNHLDSIHVQGFKSIANSGKVELRSINLVIGANGVGKSNFIESFHFLHKLRNGNLQNYIADLGYADEVAHLGLKTTQAIKIELTFTGEADSYAIELRSTQKNTFIPFKEIAYFWNKKNKQPLATLLLANGMEAGISSGTLGGVKARIPNCLDRISRFHIHDTSRNSPLRLSNKINDNAYLRPDGSNLAAFLYRLQVRFNKEYRLIVQTVQRIAPFFKDFNLHADHLNSEYINLDWSHKGTDKHFGASTFSDGTLRFIALTTLLLQPIELRPSVILIDEPELGLHPAAIELLAALIKQAAVDTQVIAATQSPILLDYFEPKDVLVAERKGEGTVFNRLNATALQTWLEDFSLGQLWEKNHLGGNPSAETKSI